MIGLLLRRGHFGVWRVVAAALCALTVVAVAVADNLLEESLRRGVDDNWRGAYDLLITADMPMTPVSDRFGRALVDPNFGNVTAASLSPEVVNQIKGMADVEVAAPIGLLGRWGQTLDWATLEVPADVLRAADVHELRIGWQVQTNDGLGPRRVQDEVIELRIDASEWDGTSTGRLADVGVELTGSLGSYDGVLTDDSAVISLMPLPVASTTVFAIDPAAEKALLGDQAGAFLDPLILGDELLHGGSDAVTARDVVEGEETDVAELWQVPNMNQLNSGQTAELFAAGHGALTGMYGPDNPLTPYLRNTDAYPPLVLEANLEHAQGERVGNGVGQWENIGQVRLDISAQRWPFVGSSLSIPWPGTESNAASSYVMADTATGVSGLIIESADPGTDAKGSAPTVRLAPPEYLSPVPQLAAPNPDGTGLGEESAYREPVSTEPMQLGRLDSDGAAPIAVGTYEPGITAGMAGAASYVPLGAYDPAKVQVGDQVLEPTLHGLGLAAQPSTALVTIRGAQEAFGVQAPVTAIRVRISGLQGYNTESLTRLAGVRDDLEALGLHVTEVAGASRQSVNVEVPGYAFGTREGSTQEVGELESVQMDFTTLGAAASAQEQAAKTQRGVLIAALISTAGTLVVVWLVGLRQRRRADAVLFAVGLTWMGRLRWHLRRDTLPMVVIAAGGAVATMVSPTLGLWAGAQTAVVLVCMIGAHVSAVASGDNSNRWPRRRTGPGSTQRTKRQGIAGLANGANGMSGMDVIAAAVRASLMGIFLCAAGLTSLVTALALATSAVIGGLRDLGTTGLGAMVASETRPMFAAVLGCVALGGLVVMGVATGVIADQARPRTRVLADTAGWSRRELSTIPAAQSVLLAVVTAVGIVGTLTVAQLTGLSTGSWFAWTVAVASAAGLAGLVLFTTVLWKETT